MIKLIQKSIKEYDKKVWIMYNSDSSDKFFCEYISNILNTATLCLITQSEMYLIVHELDKENVKLLNYNKNRIHFFFYNKMEEMSLIYEDIIAKLHFPCDVSLSYSTMGDKNTDILSHGRYLTLTRILKKPYAKYHKKVKFSSAEKLMYEVISKRSNKELSRLKLIANITNTILEETFENIKIGISEIEIVDLTKKIAKKIMESYMKANDIVNFDFAWENCPIVLTGENLAKGGHSLPSKKLLKHGDTIYFDFGIKVKFKDGMCLYTDMQRMGYALKKNEIEAPKNVKKVFDTLVNAIEDGIDEMKPGVKGYKIDNIVRKQILKKGYPDYNHATGHPVGRDVHGAGAIISIRTSKRASLPLVEDGVYTLEPRVNIANGGSIEEMIQVTKYGGVPLCKTQKELYLVK